MGERSTGKVDSHAELGQLTLPGVSNESTEGGSIIRVDDRIRHGVQRRTVGRAGEVEDALVHVLHFTVGVVGDDPDRCLVDDPLQLGHRRARRSQLIRQSTDLVECLSLSTPGRPHSGDRNRIRTLSAQKFTGCVVHPGR